MHCESKVYTKKPFFRAELSDKILKRLSARPGKKYAKVLAIIHSNMIAVKEHFKITWNRTSTAIA
jgi:hypothetical protein